MVAATLTDRRSVCFMIHRPLGAPSDSSEAVAGSLSPRVVGSVLAGSTVSCRRSAKIDVARARFYPLTMNPRSFIGWTGQFVPCWMARIVSTWSADSSTGVTRTCQVTPSAQGGVVSDPW